MAATGSQAAPADGVVDRRVSALFKGWSELGVTEEVQEIERMRGQGIISRIAFKQPDGYPDLTAFMAGEAHCPKLTLHAGDSDDPIQAMDCWNVAGSKVYTYRGLGACNEPFHPSTACGILMLDSYAIQERVGDPASPCTWFPYQAFYAIPKGVTFAKCKAVGASGKDAGTAHPEETRAICRALDALATVAADEGKRRLFVTGDCGYYSLALEAYVEGLLDFGWARKADACAFAPSFRVRDRIDVYLCLGTPQMISTPDPANNIAGKADNCSIVYATADLRGWYGGDTFDELNARYPCMDVMKEILRFNEGIPWGLMLAWHPDDAPRIWGHIADMLIEFEEGTAAFLLGAYVAWASKPEAGDIEEGDAQPGSSARRHQWAAMPVAAHKLLEDLEEDKGRIVTFLEHGLVEIFRKGVEQGLVRKGWSGDPSKLSFADLTPAETMAAFAFVMGGSKDSLANGAALAQELQKTICATIRNIINFDEGTAMGEELPDASTTVTCAGRYIEWYCKLIMRLNKTVIRSAFKEGKVGHAIDAERVYLVDALYIPGFGEQVAEGLSVWCYATFYCWLSSIYACFASMVRDDTSDRPIVFHHECTELFQFTNFIQQHGMPCIDGPNYMVMASMSTNEPLQFQRFPGSTVPAAMCFGDGKWYRSASFPLRTPDSDSRQFRDLKRFVYPDGLESAEHRVWDAVKKGAVMLGEERLGYGPGHALHVNSTALVEKYIGVVDEFQGGGAREGCVQYGVQRPKRQQCDLPAPAAKRHEASQGSRAPEMLESVPSPCRPRDVAQRAHE